MRQTQRSPEGPRRLHSSSPPPCSLICLNVTVFSAQSPAWFKFYVLSPWSVRRGSAGQRPPPTFFPLLALLGADVKATTKDGDTVFTCIIFLLGETVGGDKEEAQLINRFCFQVTQLLLAHGADPSVSPCCCWCCS